MSIQPTASPIPAAAAVPAAPSAVASGSSFSFHDLLETINPLQHLPIVSTIYRHLTGDTINNTDRIVGDTLYGGPVGLVAGMINARMVDGNGKDMGDRMIAMVTGDHGDTPTAAPANVAAAPAPYVPKPIAGSVTLSALPSKPQPNEVPYYTAATAAETEAMIAASKQALTAQPRPQVAQAQPQAQAMPAAMPALPSFGSSETASALAAAAPITPQLLQAEGMLPSPAAAPPAAPITGQASALPPSIRRGLPIDTSPEGIMAMQAHTHTKAPVPLDLPAGILPSVARQATPVTPVALSSVDFAERMKQGLEKYQAMMKQQGSAQGAVQSAVAVPPVQTVH